MINPFHILYNVNPKRDSNTQRWVDCQYAPPVSPSSPEHLPTTPVEIPSQRYEARIEEGKLYYDKRWSVPAASYLMPNVALLFLSQSCRMYTGH